MLISPSSTEPLKLLQKKLSHFLQSVETLITRSQEFLTKEKPPQHNQDQTTHHQ